MTKSARSVAACVMALSIMSGGAAAATPAAADPLPQGRTKWLPKGASDTRPTVVVRKGDRVKFRFWEGYDRRNGYWLKQTGTVSGSVLRLYVHEGMGGWTTARYRLKGKTLRIKWQGRSKWSVLKRT